MTNEAPETPLPPRKGDALFRDDLRDKLNNACLGWGGQHCYTEGYRRGAQRLVEYVVKTHFDQDYLVYPIIFLYRHHVELALKGIILETANIIGHPLTHEEKKNLGKHRLDLLWQDLKPMWDALRKK